MARLKIAVTQGDTNGIGLELILRTFSIPEILEMCTPIVYGNAHAASYYKKILHLDTEWHIIPSASNAVDGKLNFVNVCNEEVSINIGQATPESGKQALLALEYAVKESKEGLVDCLLTAPINKSNIQTPDFNFTGHTEYLEKCYDTESLMILYNEMLRVALVTTHTPISKVGELITPEKLKQKIRQLHGSLKRDFLVSAPRIAVLALNPHCGDNGLIGNEEKEVIIPVINTLREEGLSIYGPYSADGFFGNCTYKHFDAVLAMYHDQGLAPLKALSMDGVNFTSGLPIVRTSPDHGTAYEIAGKGEADTASFLQSIYAAIDITRNRETYDKAHENPLPKLFFDRRDNHERD